MRLVFYFCFYLCFLGQALAVDPAHLQCFNYLKNELEALKPKQKKATAQSTYQSFSPFKLEQAKNLAQLEEAYGISSFFEIFHHTNTEHMQANNQRLLDLLYQEPALTPVKGKVTAVDQEQAQFLFNLVKDNPISHNTNRYDPENKLAFCFGRAIITHVDAIRRQVHPQAIKKIWVVGDMHGWQYHVATMVRHIDQRWYVIDTVMGQPVPVFDWMTWLFGMRRSGELMFFVSDAARFGPEQSWAYTEVSLFGPNPYSDFYRGYFRDLFTYYQHQAMPVPFVQQPKK